MYLESIFREKSLKISKAINRRRTEWTGMAKRKRIKMIYKTPHRKLKIEQHEHNKKNRDELRCTWRVSNSCSTCGTHVNLVRGGNCRMLLILFQNEALVAKTSDHNTNTTDMSFCSDRHHNMVSRPLYMAGGFYQSVC